VEPTPGQAAWAAERLDCPTCGVAAGSACRTRSGTTAIKYHTARFVAVAELRDHVEIDVPADRGPGQPWRAGPAVETTPSPHVIAYVIGYALCSPVAPDLRDQLDALGAARCERIFAEEVGARVKARPELEKALALARDLAPDRPVVLAVHELRRLARNAAELVTTAATLRAGGIRLDVLTGPLAGPHDPNGAGSTFFAVLDAAALLDRDHRREKTLEGQRSAADRGHHSGRPRVFDEDMLASARALRDQGVPVPEIATRLTVTTGRNAGRHPSVASVYRALAEIQTDDIVDVQMSGPVMSARQQGDRP
jgi:DNA invertase Pin-like site-specific DNA recombinase